MTANGERDARALTITWPGLIVLTVTSYWLADGSAPTSSRSAWLLALASGKGLLIASVFMEMRHGPRVWAAAMAVFLVGEAALVAVLLS